MAPLDPRQQRLFDILNECYVAVAVPQPLLHLIDAAYAGDLTMVQAFLRAGAKLDVQGRFGVTPLDYAVMRDHPAVAHYLMSLGASITHWRRYDEADYRGRAVRTITYLLDTEAPPPLLHEALWQAAHHVAQLDCIRLLRAAGVDPRVIPPLRQQSPVEAARQAGYTDAVRVMDEERKSDAETLPCASGTDARGSRSRLRRHRAAG